MLSMLVSKSKVSLLEGTTVPSKPPYLEQLAAYGRGAFKTSLSRTASGLWPRRLQNLPMKELTICYLFVKPFGECLTEGLCFVWRIPYRGVMICLENTLQRGYDLFGEYLTEGL